MAARAKVPTRREIRATMLDAMAHVLESDTASADDKYCLALAEATPSQRENYRDRFQSVAAGLSNEWRRRAERLRK